MNGVGPAPTPVGSRLAAWLRLMLWLALAAVVSLVATGLIVFGLYLLDIALTGVGASRAVDACRDDGCVRQAWLVGGALVVGPLVIVGGAIPVILSDARSLKTASLLGWLGAASLVLASVVATLRGDPAAGVAWLLPAGIIVTLAIGTSVRWQRRKRAGPGPGAASGSRPPRGRSGLGRTLATILFVASGVDADD